MRKSERGGRVRGGEGGVGGYGGGLQDAMREKG